MAAFQARTAGREKVQPVHTAVHHAVAELDGVRDRELHAPAAAVARPLLDVAGRAGHDTHRVVRAGKSVPVDLQPRGIAKRDRDFDRAGLNAEVLQPLAILDRIVVARYAPRLRAFFVERFHQRDVPGQFAFAQCNRAATPAPAPAPAAASGREPAVQMDLHPILSAAPEVVHADAGCCRSRRVGAHLVNARAPRGSTRRTCPRSHPTPRTAKAHRPSRAATRSPARYRTRCTSPG